MPPRYAYWTIILEGMPTAFRAHTPQELLPTLKQLQGRHPDAVMKWFARGRLWDSPEQEHMAAALKKRAPRERRPEDWRPGGEHRDPRARFKVPRDEKRRRFAANLRRDRPSDEPRTRGERQPGERPFGDRPQGDRPRADRPRADRPPDRTPPHGERPRGDRPRPERPDGKPRADRAYGDRSRETRDRNRPPGSPGGAPPRQDSRSSKPPWKRDGARGSRPEDGRQRHNPRGPHPSRGRRGGGGGGQNR